MEAVYERRWDGAWGNACGSSSMSGRKAASLSGRGSRKKDRTLGGKEKVFTTDPGSQGGPKN